jgi:hypothetical protein
MTTNPTLTRKDVARMMGISADMVRRNEKRWGLTGARSDFNPRCVRYKSRIVIAILTGRGWI